MGSVRTWGWSARQSAELWERWKRGESLEAIGEALGKPASSVYITAAARGGVAPTTRRRSPRVLQAGEREERSTRVATCCWVAEALQIATLVERSSRFVMLVKIEQKDSASVAAALAKKIRRLPAELRRSLTWDRGSEMAAHKQFTVASDVQVYFCDPRSPWPRGSNENTNGLLRQYFPKGDDLSMYSQAHLNKVAAQLNGRPRETLGWKNPSEAISSLVASTG